MSRTDEGRTTKFYLVVGGRSACSEFLMISCGGRERVTVDIYGVFDVKDISRQSNIHRQ